jgi:hypothetical protein
MATVSDADDVHARRARADEFYRAKLAAADQSTVWGAALLRARVCVGSLCLPDRLVSIVPLPPTISTVSIQ